MDALRLHLRAEPELDDDGRSAWAAVFARMGLPLILVPKGQQEVSLDYSEKPRRGSRTVVVQRGADDPGNLPVRLRERLACWPSERDEHGRVGLPEDVSLLATPELDRQCRELGDRLWELSKRSEPRPDTAPRYFSLTLDIDSDGAFTGLNGLRNIRRLARENSSALPSFLHHYFRNRLGLLWDPHSKVRWFGELLEGLEVPSTFLTQVTRRHKLDNYDLRRGSFLHRQLEAVSKNRYHEIGLHSSYATREDLPDFWWEQWRRLRKLMPEKLFPVHRAHYLRVPDGCAYPWIEGREKPLVDSSLMFGGRCGFRCGTAYPFSVAPGVLELPPVAMDSALRYHEKLDRDAAFERQVELLAEVGKSGGAFVLVIHPHNLDEYLWSGWLENLLDLIDEGKSRGFLFQSLARTAWALEDHERTFLRMMEPS